MQSLQQLWFNGELLRVSLLILVVLGIKLSLPVYCLYLVVQEYRQARQYVVMGAYTLLAFTSIPTFLI